MKEEEPTDPLDTKIDTYLQDDVVQTKVDFTEKTMTKAKYQPISFIEEPSNQRRNIIIIGSAVLVLAAAAILYLLRA